MYERKSIFFLHLCLPSLDAQGLDAALGPFYSITDAPEVCPCLCKLGGENQWGAPGAPLLRWSPSHTTSPGSEWGGLGNASPAALFGKLQLAREQLLGATRPALLFQALSCRGSPGASVLVARALQQQRRVLSLSSVLSCCCSSLRTAEARWLPCPGLAPPLSPMYGFWGRLCRATTGFALREGLGVEGAREPPGSELRKGA